MAEQKSFKELLAHIVEYGKNEQMEELADVFENIMEMLKMNHRKIYEAMFQKDPDLAKKRMNKHIAAARQNMIERCQDNG